MKEKLRFNYIIDQIPVGLFVTNQRGQIDFINVEARNILKLMQDDTEELSVNMLPQAVAEFVIEFFRGSNRIFPFRVVDESLDIIANITDLGEGYHKERAAITFIRTHDFKLCDEDYDSYRQLNEQLNAIINSSSDGIWVCNQDGKVISINKASENLSGVEAESILGKNVAEIVTSGHFDFALTLEVLKKKKRISRVQYAKKTGKHILSTANPVFDEQGKLSLVVLNERDMTQMTKIMEQLERARQMGKKYKDQIAHLSMLELKNKDIISESESMQQVLDAALRLAHIGGSEILITGESGTGKGLLAKFVHNNNGKKKSPFIQINCAALPESLLEAELFGYERGAFTGAQTEGKPGLFELAQNGTLFLDEIGEMPISIQAKLLKFLDNREFRRLGGNIEKKVECMIIAATNQDLETLIRHRKFRIDLFHRINGLSLQIPPLRKRPEDVFALTRYFIEKYNERYGFQKRITQRGFNLLQSHELKGNVRELKNIINKSMLLSNEKILDKHIQDQLIGKKFLDVPGISDAKDEYHSLPETVRKIEREYLKKARKKCSSTRQMAKLLGISQATVVRKMKRYGIVSHES